MALVPEDAARSPSPRRSHPLVAAGPRSGCGRPLSSGNRSLATPPPLTGPKGAGHVLVLAGPAMGVRIEARRSLAAATEPVGDDLPGLRPPIGPIDHIAGEGLGARRIGLRNRIETFGRTLAGHLGAFDEGRPLRVERLFR